MGAWCYFCFFILGACIYNSLQAMHRKLGINNYNFNRSTWKRLFWNQQHLLDCESTMEYQIYFKFRFILKQMMQANEFFTKNNAKSWILSLSRIMDILYFDYFAFIEMPIEIDMCTLTHKCLFQSIVYLHSVFFSYNFTIYIPLHLFGYSYCLCFQFRCRTDDFYF